MTGNLQFLSQPDLTSRYIPNDLSRPIEPMRLIDGGAFTGDSVKTFLDHRISIEEVAAFEPDPENYQQLRQFLMEQSIVKSCAYELGLSDISTVKKFVAGENVSSCTSDMGTITIKMVGLDEFLPAFKPTFIKLDIEGWEKEALLGATKMIKMSQPTLAVCIYHKPADLWELPHLMRELLPAHKLALRYHLFNGFDLVAYSIGN